MLYAFVLTIHVLLCLILIAVILLQAGRGGGLADTFGGSSSTFFGTRGAVYLVRATAVCAALFMLTSLTLALLSVARGRSLMERVPVERVQETPAEPVVPEKP